MNDSEDVMLMMEFRDTYEDQWLEFLEKHDKKKEWQDWIKENQEE